jgi:DNA-directed RNA polymerase subunit F
MEDRATILRHLEQARRLITQGEQYVAHQREIVAQLERDGHDTYEAKRLLDQLQQFHALQVADRDRLENELREVPD